MTFSKFYFQFFKVKVTSDDLKFHLFWFFWFSISQFIKIKVTSDDLNFFLFSSTGKYLETVKFDIFEILFSIFQRWPGKYQFDIFFIFIYGKISGDVFLIKFLGRNLTFSKFYFPQGWPQFFFIFIYGKISGDVFLI